MNDSIASTRSQTGSWEWLTETGGTLTLVERLRFAPAIGRTFGRFAMDRTRLAFRVSPRHSYGAVDLWPIAPDSAFAERSEEEARELQSTAVLHHGYRTWVFGAALARLDDAPLDPELFHAGALVHDVGLEHIEPGQCFTRRSAEAAQTAAEHAGLERDRTIALMDGIAMHISPELRFEQSALGFYLQAGAMADLTGIRAWELPGDLRARANQAFPREDVHRVLSRCWHAEAKAVPGGRAHFADVWGGFSRIVRWLPPRL